MGLKAVKFIILGFCIGLSSSIYAQTNLPLELVEDVTYVKHRIKMLSLDSETVVAKAKLNFKLFKTINAMDQVNFSTDAKIVVHDLSFNGKKEKRTECYIKGQLKMDVETYELTSLDADIALQSVSTSEYETERDMRSLEFEYICPYKSKLKVTQSLVFELTESGEMNFKDVVLSVYVDNLRHTLSSSSLELLSTVDLPIK